MADASTNGVQKRRRGRLATACSECRRLKLKCNSKVPCDQCMKRGVGQVCPNAAATLIPRKGRRFVLATTKELHDRVDILTERIIALENALVAFDEAHPLLSSELLALKFATAEPPPDGQAPIEKPTDEGIAAWVKDDAARLNTYHASSEQDKLQQDMEEAFGTLTVRPSGDAAFLGKTARAEYLLHAHVPHMTGQANGHFGRLSPRLTQSCNFMDFAPDPRVVAEVYSFLPPFTEALRLCENYVRHGGAGYTPLLREEVFDEVVPTVYNTDPAKRPSHHMVALIFSMFALGALFDENRPARSAEAHEYFILARVAVEFDPPWRMTTLESIQTLLHIAQFFELSESDPLPSNMSWVYTGMSTRLGQSIGLHLDADRWKLPPGQLQRRNRLFWSLFAWDIHISLNFGRPPTLSPSFIDCPEPLGEEVFNVSGQREIGFPVWASKFSLVLHNVLCTIFSISSPTYQKIIDVDRDLRNYEIPTHLKISPRENDQSKLISIQQGYVLGLKEIALMNLHRSYLAQALREEEEGGGVKLLKHKFAASVMSCYRSAWRMIQALNLFWHRPCQGILARLPIPWSHGLSAAILLCLIVSRAPLSNLTRPALEILDLGEALFTEASQKCIYAANNLGCMRALRMKAYAGAQQLVYFDITCPLSTQELDRLTGHTHLLVSGDGSGSLSSSSQHSPYTTTGDDSSSPPVTSDSLEDMLGEVYIGATLFPNLPVDEAAGAQHMHPTIMHDMSFFNSSPLIPEQQFPNSNLVFPPPETIPVPQDQYYMDGHDRYDFGNPSQTYFYDEGHNIPNIL